MFLVVLRHPGVICLQDKFQFLIFPRGAMTTLIDSAAHFEGRLLELGVGIGLITAVKHQGVTTLSQLAFAIGQPGQPLVDATVDAFLQVALGRAPALNESAGIKRAAFEAQTYLVATLRQNVERGDDTPHKIAFAERASRMEALRAAVLGVSISGEHDPAHCLLDKACQMYESNTLKYLDLASCVSRTLEIQGTTKSRELTLEKGSLVLKSPEDKLTSATDSEIKVHYAMIRRGLAFQFAKLMSHEQHCEWETFLFEALHRETPPGYTKPGIAQLLQCDKAAFGRLSCTIQNIRQDGAGNYPLGVALLNLRNDPNITLYLAPLAKSSVPVISNPGGVHRPNPYDAGPNHKGKGKSKGKRTSPPIPQELRGKWFKLASGEPICFGFNCKSGCSSKTKPGDKCSRGWHVCAEPRCQKNHSLQQHAADS